MERRKTEADRKPETIITAEQIIEWDPCEEWTHDEIIRRVGDGVKARQIVEAHDISAADKCWLLLRPEIMDKCLLHLIALGRARAVLHIFERERPDDKRPREALAVQWKWMHGRASDAAWAAASDAAWAASDAAWAAASDAAWDASDAAWAASDAATLRLCKCALDRMEK